MPQNTGNEITKMHNEHVLTTNGFHRYQNTSMYIKPPILVWPLPAHLFHLLRSHVRRLRYHVRYHPSLEDQPGDHESTHGTRHEGHLSGHHLPDIHHHFLHHLENRYRYSVPRKVHRYHVSGNRRLRHQLLVF